jgi:hypothetical protein
VSLAGRLKQLDDRFVSESFDSPRPAQRAERLPRRRLFKRPLYKDWCIWLAAFAIVCALVSWIQPDRPLTFLNLLWIPPVQLAIWGAGPARTRRWLQTRNLATDIPQRIEGLGRLRDQGLITDQEFENKKGELLARI